MRMFNRYGLERELELFDNYVARLFKAGKISEAVRDRQWAESSYIATFIPVMYGDRFLPDDRASKALAAIRAFNVQHNLH